MDGAVGGIRERSSWFVRSRDRVPEERHSITTTARANGVARFGILRFMATPKDHEMVGSRIRTLIERGNITLAELKEIRCNSYEWEAMIPLLTNEALIWQAEHAIRQCVRARVPSLTYDESVHAVFAPELIRRLKEAEATIAQMKEDEHDRRMEAREEYDT